MTAEWYYIGHYGQLGPLTREQMDELVEGGVIQRDTWIWRAGMSDWSPAEQIADLASSFKKADPYQAPPPSPLSPTSSQSPALGYGRMPASAGAEPPRAPDFNPLSTSGYYPSGVRSDKSRTVGALLQLVPGLGRIYLGYTPVGVLQMITALCGIGFFWSWIDGVIILCGGVRMDGYGRQLND